MTEHVSSAPESPSGALPPQVRSPRNPRVMMAREPCALPPLPLGWDEITTILPHRYPMLLVDKITEIEPGHRIVGVKNVTSTEEFFQGHFPGHPVMPGVLILESMAQVSGVLILVTRNTPGALSYFATVEKARFRQPVRPGDCVETEAVLDVLRGPYCKVSVTGRVDGQVVVEAEYTFMTTTDAAAQAIVRSASPAALAAAREPITVASPAIAPPAIASAAVAPPAPSNGAQKLQTPSSNGDSPTAKSSNATYPASARVHPTALVDANARLGEGVVVGPFCIIEGDTSIGDRTILDSHVVIKSGVSIGKDCRLMPNVILGGEPQDLKFNGERSFVRIGDGNVFREMVTVHRATGEGNQTRIGDGNLFMAYAHIGHNCTVGDGNMISNSTGVSGHVTIENRCVIGGFVGIHQFVHVGEMAMLGGLSKVVQDVPPFCIADGRPARIHGLNIRGLRRNGVSSDERNQIAAAFKLLYRSNLNTSQALERIAAEIPTSPALNTLTSFIERVGKGRLGRQDELSGHAPSLDSGGMADGDEATDFLESS